MLEEKKALEEEKNKLLGGKEQLRKELEKYEVEKEQLKDQEAVNNTAQKQQQEKVTT